MDIYRIEFIYIFDKTYLKIIFLKVLQEIFSHINCKQQCGIYSPYAYICVKVA